MQHASGSHAALAKPSNVLSMGDEQPSFEQIALKYGTDKVTSHSYQHMYDKYLAPVRASPLKMLEIGLGCNMVRPGLLPRRPSRAAKKGA